MVGANSGVSAGSAAAKPPRPAPALPPGPPPPILTTTIFDPEDGNPTVRVSISVDDENETVARLDGGPLSFDAPMETVEYPDTSRPGLPASGFQNTAPYDAGAYDTD